MDYVVVVKRDFDGGYLLVADVGGEGQRILFEKIFGCTATNRLTFSDLIATIEISLDDYHIIQCRAFANGICEYTEQIAGIINANKKMIAERKRA